jgi:hypothetical protein
LLFFFVFFCCCFLCYIFKSICCHINHIFQHRKNRTTYTISRLLSIHISSFIKYVLYHGMQFCVIQCICRILSLFVVIPIKFFNKARKKDVHNLQTAICTYFKFHNFLCSQWIQFCGRTDGQRVSLKSRPVKSVVEL